MTQPNNLDVNKKLSKEQALYQYDTLFSDQAANIIEAYSNMDKLLSLLKIAGYSQSEAITKMSQDARKIGLRGFSETAIRYKLTDESKKQTKPGPRKSNRTVTFQQANRRLVVPEDPTIPPELVREAEIVREPPKPIDQAITIPSENKQIMLDTAKFRSDLRIALINGAKVWLSYNNAKEVIKINEQKSN
jgi:hypothetical protein